MGVVPKIGLSSLANTVQFAPLAAIGAYIRSADLLSPLTSRLAFSQPTHTEKPVAALIDLWVSILAGCRSVRQINTRVRPDLSQSIETMARLYDLRGGLEVDIREDQQGLLLSHRRKRQWCAQEMLCLLNDLAHNFLVAFRAHILADTPLADFGLYRLVHDVLNIPGRVAFDEKGFVTDMHLLRSPPYATILASTLPRLWQ